MSSPPNTNTVNPRDFFEGGGEMGKLILNHNWESTSLGPIQEWPQCLYTILGIVLHSKFPMFLLWGDDLICFYNDAFRPSFGKSGKHPSALGQTAAQCWEDAWDIVKPLIDKAFINGVAHWAEDQLVPFHRNGTIEDVYWTFSFSPVYVENGRAGGLLVTCTETTERINTLHKLQQSEDELLFAIDAAELATFDYDILNDVCKGNERLKSWFGLSGAEKKIDYQKAVAAISAKDRDLVLATVMKSLNYASGGRFDIRFSVVNPHTGAERVLAMKGKCTYTEHKTACRINGTLQDVTKDVLSLKMVDEERERRKLALEAGELGVFEVDLATNELKADKRFNEIYGFTETKEREDYVATCHPDDMPERIKALKEALKTGTFEYSTRFRHQTGAERWLRAKGMVTYDEDNKPQKLYGVIQDVTEQKAFSNSLSQQVAERTLELQRSNEDLLKFAHVASHDLKEPVRKIKTFISRIKDEFGESLPDKAQMYIQKINQSTDRMNLMIEGVLAFSSLNGSEQKIQKVDLNQVINSIVADLEIAIQNKDASIESSCLPVIEGAEVLIYQLFYNLINNSLKFTRPDVKPVISISAGLTEEAGVKLARITLSDNGIGFEQQYAGKIFETFSRLHSKDRYEGTGLGLALCKRIAERHHGRIEAESVEGAGSKFIVMLPVKQKTTCI